MESLQGISVCPGMAFAPIVIEEQERVTPTNQTTRLQGPQAAERERARLREAFLRARQALETKRAEVKERLGDQTEILEAKIALLEDEGLKEAIEAQLSKAMITAEYAVSLTFKEEIERINEKSDHYLRSRSEDFAQLRDSLLRALAFKEEAPVATTTLESNNQPRYILVTNELSIETISTLDPNRVVGVISESGSKTSHSAILLRALGIPTIFAVCDAVKKLRNARLLFLNAESNEIIADPQPEQEKTYRALVDAYQEELRALEPFKAIRAKTKEGRSIALCANLSEISGIKAAQEKGIDGIGLFRTEFMFMERSAPPSEAEQVRIYTQLLKSFPEQKVIIRTLDIGGDKQAACLNIASETNPFLGLRAIRLCLKRPELFKTQLRAILRAGVYGKSHLLFPMIASLEEVRAAKALLDEAKKELEAEKIDYAKNLPMGIMVEIPSAVLMARELAKEVDFFSIGTNDLLQYLLAVDRTNPEVASLYTPYQPVLFLALKQVVEAARQAGIWVSVCGEVAAEPTMLPLLVGLGIEELSMSASSILKAKQTLSKISETRAHALVERLSAAPLSSTLVRQHLENFFTADAPL